MAKPHYDEIFGCFDGLCDIFEDRSTEFLIQMTADTMECSYQDVVSALSAHHDQQQDAQNNG